MDFYKHLQEMVGKFEVNELDEFRTDRKLQSALLTLYIDHNWEYYLDTYVDVIIQLKTAIREHAGANGSLHIHKLLDGALITTVNAEVMSEILESFGSYWYSGDDQEVVSQRDYEMRLRKGCTGDCGICLRCMNTEARISEYRAEIA